MLFFFIALLQIITIKGSYFDILLNSDASPSALQFSLISKKRVLSQIFCLSACSVNTDCLTTVFNTIDSNCYWFTDQLGSSDILPSTSSNLYLKKSSKLNILNKLIK